MTYSMNGSNTSISRVNEMEQIKIKDVTYELQPSLHPGCEGCAGEDDDSLCDVLGWKCVSSVSHNWKEVKDDLP